jgi:cobalt/nickel transport system permease protein
MHIPDGFLDPKTAIASGVAAATGLGMAIRHVKRTFPSSRIPQMGLASAFVFAAQMLNFPVLGGTSGHLIGAVMVSVLLGPSAAVVVMSSVLILQCLMFADGGITALGANIFNMAIVAPFVGYAVYKLVYQILGTTERARFTAIAFASWLSTVATSIACAGQLAASGTAKWGVVFPAMAGIHMLIGIGEAIITTLVVAAIMRFSPDMTSALDCTQSQTGFRHLIGYGLVVSFGLVLFISPFASSWPDGLEKVAEVFGFSGAASSKALIPSPLPDYGVPGIASSTVSTIMAGAIGTLIAFALSYVLARMVTYGKKEAGSQP